MYLKRAAGGRLWRNFVLSALFFTQLLADVSCQLAAWYKFAGKHTKIDNMTLDEVRPPPIYIGREIFLGGSV